MMSSQRLMIVFGVPTEHIDAVLKAMGEAGAGQIGEYTHCSFTHEGWGRFKPSGAANPAYGERGEINRVAETRVETFCDRDKASAVVRAIRAAHPYEEPVIYLIPLLDELEL
jgi:hypothetical protein